MRYVEGNMLEAQAEALVNTVNTVGVMGKGIALQFKEKFPENFMDYAQAVKAGEVVTGKMFVSEVQRLDGRKVIINFPTKVQWFAPSRYEWIEEGLKDLVKVIKVYNITSIAVPPLGCGNGKLQWEKVKKLMEGYLGDLDNIDIQIFTPNQRIQEVLAKENQPREVKLTPARAELLYLLFHYEASGEETSLFIANKLAYFLQRMGDKQLKLKFQRHHYGPYSNQVDHLMYALNGSFINGLEQRTAKAFDRLDLRYDRYPEVKEFVEKELGEEQRQRLNSLLEFMDGYQSPLSMEALATVDSVLQENPQVSASAIFERIQNWSDRKKKIFNEHHINVALNRVHSFQKELGYS
ncbi:MAG: macro domain-containing protein [Bacteroidia bacterium]|nr:macro domain-containing protein [Bacteroidia bacterium]